MAGWRAVEPEKFDYAKLTTILSIKPGQSCQIAGVPGARCNASGIAFSKWLPRCSRQFPSPGRTDRRVNRGTPRVGLGGSGAKQIVNAPVVTACSHAAAREEGTAA